MRSPASIAPSELRLSAGDEQADARGKGCAGFSASDKLITVVEHDVAKANASTGEGSGAHGDECVAVLIAGILEAGPLLGKCIRPIFTGPEASEGVDVLNHAVFLVICLLYQKTVVLNRGDGKLTGGRYASMRRRSRGLGKQNRREQDQARNNNYGIHPFRH